MVAQPCCLVEVSLKFLQELHGHRTDESWSSPLLFPPHQSLICLSQDNPHSSHDPCSLRSWLNLELRWWNRAEKMGQENARQIQTRKVSLPFREDKQKLAPAKAWGIMFLNTLFLFLWHEYSFILTYNTIHVFCVQIYKSILSPYPFFPPVLHRRASGAGSYVSQ